MANDIARARDRGFGTRVGLGRSPALLVVDFTRAFTAPDARLGMDMTPAITEANRLLAAAERAGIPVILSTIAYDDPGRDSGVWRSKIAGLDALVTGSEGVDQDPRLLRVPGDRILVKRFASCFFGTGLADDLRAGGVDTLVIAGCTTSGCVRASAVDACSHGFRTIVAREATADRLQDAHAQSLVDIDLKYGDVMPVDAIVAYLRTVGAGSGALNPGAP
ncbi:isochorismatase family protein [Methylobacterium sp. EM32]|uniref:isochorismatase family protein n=1 Tax=Methylobacterium sp. EM32 TaxID=3163481 RepID=UPI0033AFA4E5